MTDMAKMGARIRELEGRRARGESVPELDALYQRMAKRLLRQLEKLLAVKLKSAK